jgi:hypothetical protein
VWLLGSKRAALLATLRGWGGLLLLTTCPCAVVVLLLLLQDYPKALPADARVGFTVINQVCCAD